MSKKKRSLLKDILFAHAPSTHAFIVYCAGLVILGLSLSLLLSLDSIMDEWFEKTHDADWVHEELDM